MGKDVYESEWNYFSFSDWKIDNVTCQKQEIIEQSVSHHLGVLYRELFFYVLKEKGVFNDDETGFVIDHHNHRKLARRGDEEVK